MMSGSHLSKDFFDLVKSIGESRSKQEEDKIITHEVLVLKSKMASKNVPPKKMKEYLIRMIYVEMLGHDATFGHIHGIKMVSESKLLEKRVGYLAISLTLHPGHSFILLLVNSLMSDLKSDNFLKVSMALTVVCKMVNAETVPALLPLVTSLLDHKQANIRKKAVCALHRFHQIDNECVVPILEKIRKILCDKDPSVMGASLVLFQDLAMTDATRLKDLVPSFVSILKQVTEHRLPRDYDYHRMPAPWVQMNLLQILAVLGHADREASQGMYEILHEVMKRADIGINVGYAIVYECVKTITTIYPEQSLIEDAALSISRFLTSENHNLKYLGVNSLAAIVQINPKYAAEHQLLVIDCLEDPDETLRRKTLHLIYSMTNATNVIVIVEKLIGYLGNTTDVYLRTDLVSRINHLAEKFSPNTWWYIETCTRLFELGGSVVKNEVAHNLMRLIAEAEEVVEDEEGNEIDLRAYTVEVYLDYLEKPVLPDIMMQVIAWTLGEFGKLSSTHRIEDLIGKLNSAMERHYDDATTRSWIISSLTKLAASLPASVPLVAAVADRYKNSVFVDLQQRAHEFLELAKTPATMTQVLPPNAHTEDVDVDEDLGFLNGYVSAALAAGAAAYNAERDMEDMSATSQAFVNTQESATSGLRFDAYEKHASQQISNNVAWDNPAPAQAGGGGGAAPAAAKAGFNLPAGKKKMWGPAGFNTGEPAAPAPAATPAYMQQPAATPTPAAAIAQPAAQPAARRFSKSEPAPKELTEREKAAASLFGGGGSFAPKARVGRPGVRAGRPATRPAAAAAAVAPAPAAAPVAPVAEVDFFASPNPAPAAGGIIDLMGFDTPAPAAAAAAPAPAAAPPAAAPAPAGDGLMDLLGDVFGGASAPAPAPQAAAPATTAPGGNDPFASMFGGMSVGAPAAAPAATPTSPLAVDPFAAIGGGGDLLGGGGVPGGAPVRMDLGSAGMSASMRQRLSNFRKAKEQVLASDDTLHVSAIKVFCDDRTLLAIFITNQRQSPIQNVTIQLGYPSGLNLSFDGEPQPQVNNQNNQLLVPSIPALSTSTQIVSLQCTDTSFLQQPLFQGQIAFSGASSKLGFQLSLSVGDFMRPATMSTQQFGSFWKQYSCERKFQVAGSSVQNSNDFMSKVQNQLGIHPVQTIGQENICAGKLVSPNQQDLNQLCFVHGKVVAGGSLVVLVRTKAPQFSEAVAALANQVFK